MDQLCFALGILVDKKSKFLLYQCVFDSEKLNSSCNSRYYATHQYFLSKRSLYLVVWRIDEGKSGLIEVLQWLGNIQARAPNSPVIIVGTHHDNVGTNISENEVASLQQYIRERFIAVTDSEKIGLPKVMSSIEISCK